MPEIPPTTLGASTISQAYGAEAQAAIDTLEKIIAKYSTGQITSTDGKGGTDGTNSAGVPELELPAEFDPTDLVGLLMILKNKNSEEQMKGAKEYILTNKDKMKAENDERAEKLKEAADAAGKAKKSGLAAKIFGWIGAIASAIIGAVLIATGVGVAAGVCMLAASAIMITQMSMQEAGAFEKMDPKLAQGLMIGMAVAAAVFGIAGGVAGIAGTAAATMSTVAQGVKIGAQVAAGIATLGGGASGIATSVYNKESADAQANAKEIEAFLIKLQAAMEDEQDRLKQLIEQLNEGFQIFSDIQQQHSEAESQVFQNMQA